MRRKLVELRVPACEGCGYRLRGVPPSTEHCPECGRLIDEPVRALLLPQETHPETSDEGNAGAPAS